MSLSFRYIKTGGEINSTFFVWDGREMADLDHWHIGDRVSLIFDVDEETASAINDMGYRDIRAFNSNMAGGDEWTVHIQFLVAERRHAAAWKDTGKLQSLGSDITLQAHHWLWEDIFLWVSCSEKPRWAD